MGLSLFLVYMRPQQVRAVYCLLFTVYCAPVCPKRIGSEFFDPINKLRGNFGKTSPHCRRQIDHPGTLTVKSNLVQQAAQMLYPLFSS